MKPVYTLGICNDETSSACLFKDGELVSAASEERFSCKKLDSSFPQQAIDFVLSNSNISFKNLSNIAYSWAKGFAEVSSQIFKRYGSIAARIAPSIFSGDPAVTAELIKCLKTQ